MIVLTQSDNKKLAVESSSSIALVSEKNYGCLVIFKEKDMDGNQITAYVTDSFPQVIQAMLLEKSNGPIIKAS